MNSSTCWVLLIKREDYVLDTKLTSTCIDYFEYSILEDYLCILVDLRSVLNQDPTEENA